MGEVNGGTMLALVLRLLGGGTSKPTFCTKTPTAFIVARTSSFTVWTNPFDFFLPAPVLREVVVESGIGMLTLCVMMFSTLGRELDDFLLTDAFGFAFAVFRFLSMADAS